MNTNWKVLAAIALVGLLSFGIGAYVLVQNADTNEAVRKVVVQREGDHREFLALIRALRRAGVKVPEGVMPQQPSNHGHQQPGPSGGQPGHSGEPREHATPGPVRSTVESVGEVIHETVCSVNALGVRVCP